MRFKILESPMKNYPIEAQRKIVLACCVLYNFIKDMQPHDQFLTDLNIASNMDVGDAEGAQAAQFHVMSKAQHD